MRIAIVTNFLYPEGIGGTELYCFNLANALIARGNEVYWFVPNFDKPITATEERGDGIRIVRFAGVKEIGRQDMDFTISSFIKEMKKRDIRIAHFQEFGGFYGISSELFSAAKQNGISTVVTFHLANYICQTGMLHFAGAETCDGRMIPGRCASCSIFTGMTSSVSLNLQLARMFSHILDTRAARMIPRIRNYMNGIGRKEVFIDALRKHADVVVTLTRWYRQILLVNGITENQLTYIPQVSPEIKISNTGGEQREGYVYIGRIDEKKGIDIILGLAGKLKAEMPGAFIDIYGPIYGPYYAEAGNKKKSFRYLNQYDNIRYKGIIDPEKVLSVMNRYKLVILPSLVAEMAPLIVMEANALRVPVVVSDVPGSTELIKEYDCGFIFRYNSPADLFDKIRLAETSAGKLAFRQPAENNFYSVAGKYEQVYSRLISKQ